MTPYFAYGSNMSRGLMARLCPGGTACGLASLKGWRFAIIAAGYASIMPDPAAAVLGVLWQLAPRDVAALNTYESLRTGLYRQRYLAVSHHSRHVRALVYVAANCVAGQPRPGYLRHCHCSRA
jgi:hypothetical protein